MSKLTLDSDQLRFGGLDARFASEVPRRPSRPLDPRDDSLLAQAIRKSFPAPGTHPDKQGLISRRFRRLYSNVTEAEACRAVARGLTSPAIAIKRRAIPAKNHPYVGFDSPRISFRRFVGTIATATDDRAGHFITDTRHFIKAGVGPSNRIRDFDSLAAFVRLQGGDDIVLGAAQDVWRRYQLWIGE